MGRPENVKRKLLELQDEGENVSARRLSEEMQLHENDVHRCLNILEKNGEIRTYRREVLGRLHRIVEDSS